MRPAKVKNAKVVKSMWNNLIKNNFPVNSIWMAIFDIFPLDARIIHHPIHLGAWHSTMTSFKILIFMDWTVLKVSTWNFWKINWKIQLIKWSNLCSFRTTRNLLYCNHRCSDTVWREKTGECRYSNGWSEKLAQILYNEFLFNLTLFRLKAAKAAKTVKYGSNVDGISTCDPEQYAKRFIEFMDKAIEWISST